VAAFIDLVGGGYVELALELGIARDRIDTIVAFPAIAKHGAKGVGGAAAASAATLAELAEAIAAGELVVPIQRTYPLDDARAALECRTRTQISGIAGLWSRRPRVRVPSLTLFVPANIDFLLRRKSRAGQTRGKFGPAKPPWRARCRSRRPRCRAEYRSAASGMHGVVSRRPVGSRRSA
jgi:hypothetical protein